MAYDALERGRDILVTAVNSSLTAVVTAVASGHAISNVPANRAVYTSFEARPMFPNVEVTPPRGRLKTLSKGAISTEAEYWLIASISGADPQWVDDACMVYLTALIRLAAAIDGDSYLAEPVEFDFSPPVFTDDTQQKRSVGVLVRMTFNEDV